MYPITDNEIDELCSGYESIDLGLFTLCLGIFVAFIIALFTTEMQDRIFTTFVAISFLSFLAAIFFGIRTLKARQRVKERVKRIRESRQQ